jgi:plasmid maintenance system antidote protein VapI
MAKKLGGVRLHDWLKEERRTQAWLGEQIDTHQTNVSAWMNKRPIPLEMAVKIEKLTGIPVEDWTIEADETGPQLPSTGTD